MGPILSIISKLHKQRKTLN